MKLIKLLAATCFALSLLTMPVDAAPKGKLGKCCEKAKKEGKDCEHKCCVEAKKAGKNCEKCGGTNE
jgi:hypothetical protein